MIYQENVATWPLPGIVRHPFKPTGVPSSRVHAKAIIAADFFAVVTATSRLVYVWVANS